MPMKRLSNTPTDGSDPLVGIVVGPLAGMVPSAGGYALQFPCAHCGAAVWITEAALAYISRDSAKPSCWKCVPSFVGPEDELEIRCRHVECGWAGGGDRTCHLVPELIDAHGQWPPSPDQLYEWW